MSDRKRLSCPDCGLALVEVPDFFGSPRFAHPTDTCVPVTRNTPQPEFTASQCASCKAWFPQRTKGYRRATCSEPCVNALRRQNMIQHARPKWRKRPERRQLRSLRERWQRKAEVQDRRWAA